MALIPPAILAALVGAGIGNAIKQTNKPQNKKLLPLLLESSEMVKKQKQAQNRKNVATGGSSRGIRKARRPRATTMAITTPASTGGVSRNYIPRSIGALGGLVITHCEPFGQANFLALGAYQVGATALIPGIFPYLTGIASNFAKYSWLKIHIYYVPSCPTTTLGEVSMSTGYDWQDNLTPSFLQVAQMKGGISFPPWGGGAEYGPNAITIDVDVRDFDKPRYNFVTVTTFNALTASDKNNYSPTILFLGTQGSTTAISPAGRIWVEYTIRLIDPVPSAINQ